MLGFAALAEVALAEQPGGGGVAISSIAFLDGLKTVQSLKGRKQMPSLTATKTNPSIKGTVED